MESWEAIQKTLNHIEENLSNEIEISSLAKMAGLSAFYYQRLFKRLVNKPVMEYIKLRRLAKAAEELVDGNARIIDVGLESGFENHETFTRAFKDAYGLTPNDYRKNPRPLSHFIKPDVSMKYRLVDENMPLAAEGIVLEVSRNNLPFSRHFMGLSGDVEFSGGPMVDFLAELWNDFHKTKMHIGCKLNDGNEIGVASPSNKEGHISYYVGAEVGNVETLKGFKHYEIHPGNYIVCSFEAENFHQLTTEALDKAVRYMYQTWLPKNNVKTENFMAELYQHAQNEESAMEIWFMIRGE